MTVYLFSEDELRQSISIEASIDAVEEAFAVLSRGEAMLPSALNLEIPEKQGQVRVKGAYIKGSAHYVIKVVSTFHYGNKKTGRKEEGGMMLAFDARNGKPVAFLLDNGYLTNLRTGASGAAAIKHLARKNPRRMTIVGSGTQARFQMRAISRLGIIGSTYVWGRNPNNADRCAREMVEDCGCSIGVAESLEDSVRRSDVVVTVTRSRKPLVKAEWVQPGTTVVAVGSDSANKQELDVEVLAKADLLIADSVSQCAEIGEIHHALDAGAISLEDVDGEIGDVITGKLPGRTSDDQIVVCDLTGIGVLDAAIASLALENVVVFGLGSEHNFL